MRKCEKQSKRVDNSNAKLNLGEFVQAMSYLDESFDASDAAQTAYVRLFQEITNARAVPSPLPVLRSPTSTRRSSQKRNSIILESTRTDGVGEEDFVHRVSQFFRNRRPKKGIRTNGTPLVDISNGMFIGGKGLAHVQGMEIQKKPGLRRSTAVSILLGTKSNGTEGES